MLEHGRHNHDHPGTNDLRGDRDHRSARANDDY
jgi:hypothetical protein